MTSYKQYSGQAYQGLIRADFAPPDLLLNHPERIGQLEGAEHLLDCEGRQIHRVPLRADNQVRSCFTYYFTNRSLTRALRRSYALRTLRRSALLREHGFPTLEVLAAVKKKGEVLNWTSVLVALEIQSVFEIPSKGDHVFQIHDFLEFSPDWPVALGRYIARFHNAGFIHGDLKTRHVLAGVSQGEHRFYLVDLEKCQFLPRCPVVLRAVLAARDLIQLLVSLEEPKAGARVIGDVILKSYFEEARYGPVFARRVRRIVNIYQGETGFRQGETVVENLWRMIWAGRKQNRP